MFYARPCTGGTRRPDQNGEWLSLSAAKQLYESCRDVEIVDADDVDDAGTPRPRWTIEFTGSDATVRFLDRHAAVWRRVDYRFIEGRLWRQGTHDYTYPDDSRLWDPAELMSEVESVVQPDGTGSLTILDKTECKPGTWLVSQFSARASETYWIGRPEFGDWASLARPGPSAYDVAGGEAVDRAR